MNTQGYMAAMKSFMITVRYVTLIGNKIILSSKCYEPQSIIDGGNSGKPFIVIEADDESLIGKVFK